MNSNLQISLNGTFITGRIDGADDFKITLRRKDEDGKLAKSFSSELTFYDDGYAILKTILIDDPMGFGKYVDVKVYDTCCGKVVFEGEIRGDAIDWCYPLCQIRANITEKDNVFSCLETEPIYSDKRGFLQYPRYAVRYCLEHRPVFMQIVASFLSVILEQLLIFVGGPIVLAIGIIMGIVWLICSVVAALSRRITLNDCRNLNPVGAFDTWANLINDVKEWIVPCGFFHPSAYVRDYIKNVCDICGLTQFQSSILNDPSSIYKEYYNLMLVSAPIKRGREADSQDYKLITDNVPLETLDTLMNEYLKPMFNGEYWVSGNTLYFERKDHIIGNAIWIDADSLLQQGLIEGDVICFNWIKKERWAYGRYEYTPDAMEYIGNEAKPRYADIVDWNTPNPTLAQKKEYKVTIPSGMTRTLKDGMDNVYMNLMSAANWWNNILFHNNLHGVYAGKPVMVIAQHSFFNYKFIIAELDGVDAYVKKDYSDAYIGGALPDTLPFNRANYPLWFKEGKQGVSGYQNNLYSMFHYIDNPRESLYQEFEYNFVFRFDCGQVASFDYYKNIKLTRGGVVKYGSIDEVVIDYNRRTISVKGKVN